MHASLSASTPRLPVRKWVYIYVNIFAFTSLFRKCAWVSIPASTSQLRVCLRQYSATRFFRYAGSWRSGEDREGPTPYALMRWCIRCGKNRSPVLLWTPPPRIVVRVYIFVCLYVCAGGVFGAARIVALYYCVCVRVYTRARMCAGMCVGVYVCGCVCVCVFVCMCGKNRSPVLSCTSPPELLCTPLPRIIVHFTPRIIMHTTPQNYRAHHFPVLLCTPAPRITVRVYIFVCLYVCGSGVFMYIFVCLYVCVCELCTYTWLSTLFRKNPNRYKSCFENRMSSGKRPTLI